jgi:hypothetical protein
MKRLARRSARTAAASAFVIANRIGRTSDASEMTRMVVEKQAAALESIAAVQAAVVRACFTPTSMASAWASVANAALAPYYKRSRSNARRLSRKR